MKKLLVMLSILGVFAAYGCADTEDAPDAVTDDTTVEDTTADDAVTPETDVVAPATDATADTTVPAVE
ncbi:MAG: hypothetical protein WCT46_01870 [Candidatus Gracilibacteria bacterium]